MFIYLKLYKVFKYNSLIMLGTALYLIINSIGFLAFRLKVFINLLCVTAQTIKQNVLTKT